MLELSSSLVDVYDMWTGPYVVINERDNTIDDEVSAYFGTYGDSLWSIFVAITSSSFPNQVRVLNDLIWPGT